MSFEISDTFADYEVVGVLGAGGMGRVYKVRNVLSNRFEAMKVLLDSVATADQGERFLREIRVQASLDHPNIAALRTALRVENQVVMIMELVEGTTLQAMLERGPLPLRAAVNYASQALSALSYAHQRGVIHRDIKPGNIMVTPDGIVKLTDFGIAKIGVDRSLTTTGATIGSIYYMSPEQVNGSSTLDGRSDLYSLGVTLYQLITGERPFTGPHDYAIFSAHLNEPPIPPQQKNPKIPPELNQAILTALAKNPGDRFQTAAEFLKALQQIDNLPEDVSSTRTIPLPVHPATPPVHPVPARFSASRSKPSASTASLEMAYVLFMDIVAYSNLPMDRQSERITQLVEIVRNTEEFRRAQDSDQLISLPTGDGMALVFFQNPVAPVHCASEISRKLASYPEIKLRMGIHNGPVYRIPDINTNLNVAGGGINMAQRVMDCGDAGHILVSKTVADVLGQLSDWAGCFHDLGETEVKHGVRIHVVNFYRGDVGNPGLPQKIQNTLTVKGQRKSAAVGPVLSRPPARRTAYVAAGGGALLVAAILVFGTMQFTKGKDPGRGSNPAPPVTQDPGTPPPQKPPAPPSGETVAPLPPSTPPVNPISPSPPPVDAGSKKPPNVVKEPAPQIVQPGPAPSSDAKAPPPATPAPAPSSPPAQQNPSGTEDKAALQEQRERMALLGGRVAAVRSSLETLERQQQRSGLSLRSDMAAARESMNYLMGEARTSLAAADLSTTKRNLDLAEQQVTKLERFLGR